MTPSSLPVTAHLRGCLSTVLVVLVALVALVPVLLLVILKCLAPASELRQWCTDALIVVAECWAEIYRFLYWLICRPQWKSTVPEGLSRQNSYLIISNHQSWADIMVLIFTLNRKVPFFKFFMKQRLIWLPIIGIAAWGVDCPRLHRYSKERLLREPELRGRDATIVADFCERLKNHPASIINYAEGTRFTPAKHEKQSSPYRHLLRPKTGGIAMVVSRLGTQISAVLDMTVVYPQGRHGFWAFLCGCANPTIVDIEVRPVPKHLIGLEPTPDEDDPFKIWLSELWQQKDQLIDRYKAELQATSS